MKRLFAVAIMASMFLLTSVAKGQAQMIADGKKVTFDYTLTVDGKVADTSVGKQPIEYTQGTGQLIKGLESRMAGMKVGEEKTIQVPSAEGYGPVLPNAVQTFPKTFFPKDFELKVGQVVPLQNKEGQTFPATVKEIQADQVLLDLNHPMAGKDLTFDIKIIAIK